MLILSISYFSVQILSRSCWTLVNRRTIWTSVFEPTNHSYSYSHVIVPPTAVYSVTLKYTSARPNDSGRHYWWLENHIRPTYDVSVVEIMRHKLLLVSVRADWAVWSHVIVAATKGTLGFCLFFIYSSSPDTVAHDARIWCGWHVARTTWCPISNIVPPVQTMGLSYKYWFFAPIDSGCKKIFPHWKNLLQI